MKSVVSVFGFKPVRIGGGEHFAREISLQLGRHGWNSILCFASPPPEAVRQYLDLPNITLEVLESPWEVKRATVQQLARILRRHRPGILHLNYTGFLGPYPWLAKLYGVEKVFFTDHSSQIENYQPRPAPLWKRMAARAINGPLTGAVCVSDYGYGCLTALDLIPRRRVRRIYNGIRIPEGSDPPGKAREFRRKFGIPQDRTLIVQVSWMRPEKGIGDLLEAARQVIAQNPKVHFALVGEGAYRESFTRQAAEMGLRDRVTWTGLVEDPMRDGVYAAADMVCQVSRWEEVFGYVIAEGMAASRPVVATRVGGIPEVVEDTVSGFLTERGHAAGMAEKILLLAGDPSLRDRMGRAGRRRAELLFDNRKNVAEFIRLYGIDLG